MRNISFSKTTDQVLARTKTVTRRLGWGWLLPGTVLRAVDKAMGLKRGQHPKTLAVIRVVSVRREALSETTDAEARLEGFPEMTGRDFVAFFCREMGTEPHNIVTRIEFAYLPEDP